MDELSNQASSAKSSRSYHIYYLVPKLVFFHQGVPLKLLTSSSFCYCLLEFIIQAHLLIKQAQWCSGR